MYQALRAAFDGSPFNTYLHRIPGADFHWHFEAQPRVGKLAALELGADMYINAVTPQASANRWTTGVVTGRGATPEAPSP
jgi:hypothetical protein